MRYLPHTETEIAEMLARINVPSVDALFENIPSTHALKRPLALEPALDEAALMDHLEALAEKNSSTRAVSFLGGGAYDHHIPPAVDQLLLRSEFYTAYTPYQPEVSQGTLQSIFEFQTIVAQIFGMEISNASMYDFASAAGEAVLMARRVTNRPKILVSNALHPETIETIRTYLGEEQHAITLVPVAVDGRTDLAALEAAISDDVAAFVIGYPNFYGVVEDLAVARKITEAKGALLVTSTTEPYALALIKPPGAYGVDIATGDGQALALPPQYGGPGVGLFTCKSQFVRQMPGRVCGETVDANGKRGFVLTLSTREQHIRRERATSNICTNHGLVALAMTIRTAMLGKQGFEKVARICLSNAEYLKKLLLATGLVQLPYSGQTFNEFVIRIANFEAARTVELLAKTGYLIGVPLSRFDASRPQDLLVAVTERHTKEHLDRFAELIKITLG